jgi:hypothetical protein
LACQATIPAGLDVREHGLKLAGELVAALGLELDQQPPLGVVAHAAPSQQPLGQVLLVILFKHVLLLQAPVCPGGWLPELGT